jgi:hypothetical protein
MSCSQELVLECVAANPGIRRSEVDHLVDFDSAHKLRALLRDGKIRREVRTGTKPAYGGKSWFVYFAVEGQA